MKKFVIHAGSYEFEIRVVIGNKLCDVAKYINKKQHRKGTAKYTSEHFDVLGRYCPHEKYCPFIWLPSKPKTARQLSTVAHEILHSVFDCMEWAGIKYSRESEEAYTYLHTHLMKQFLKKCGYK
jgi:hypothetical protein